VAAEADNREACGAFYTKVWRWYTTLSFLGGAVLILGSRLFSRMLFSDAYQDAWMYVPVLTVATVFMGLDTFLGSVYFACRKTTGSMITALCGAGLNFLLNWLLIPSFGAMGASVATLVSYGTVYVLRLVTVRRLIPFRVEAGRGAVNALLLLALCVSVTLTGGTGHILSPTAWWLVAGGLGLVMLGFNGKAWYEMGVGTVRAVCRKSKKREQTADAAAPEKGDTTESS
jgi:O-antigen/teichoic acid export membrane protein